MKTKQEHFLKSSQGSGLVYVLIAVALFAALSLTLMRQNDTSETSILEDDEVVLYATQLINYAAQAKSSVDQMFFSGSDIDDLGFALPGQAAFTAGTQASRVHQVFHPEGGGLSLGVLPDKSKETGTDPVSGWYMGRFNNVEWSDSTDTEVMLTAYRIKQTLCQELNKTITGSTTIPALNVNPANLLVDDAYHTGTNADFDIANCAACEGYNALCVSNAGATEFHFYNVLSDR